MPVLDDVKEDHLEFGLGLFLVVLVVGSDQVLKQKVALPRQDLEMFANPTSASFCALSWSTLLPCSLLSEKMASKTSLKEPLHSLRILFSMSSSYSVGNQAEKN